MYSIKALALAAVTVAGLPALAHAAPAMSTANVNMRSGPSTAYPPVQVIPAGNRVEIFGCLQSANWCDVAYRGYRGWVSGSYLQAAYSQRRVYVDPQYYRPLGIPSVTFSVGTYWDRHYRSRDFYRERDRWRDFGRQPPRREERDSRRDGDGRDGRWEQGNRGQGQDNNRWGQDNRRGDDRAQDGRRDDRRDSPRADNRDGRDQRDGRDVRDRRDGRGPGCQPGQQFVRGECR